jgi:hypothetical protein
MSGAKTRLQQSRQQHEFYSIKFHKIPLGHKNKKNEKRSYFPELPYRYQQGRHWRRTPFEYKSTALFGRTATADIHIMHSFYPLCTRKLIKANKYLLVRIHEVHCTGSSGHSGYEHIIPGAVERGVVCMRQMGIWGNRIPFFWDRTCYGL